MRTEIFIFLSIYHLVQVTTAPYANVALSFCSSQFRYRSHFGLLSFGVLLSFLLYSGYISLKDTRILRIFGYNSIRFKPWTRDSSPSYTLSWCRLLRNSTKVTQISIPVPNLINFHINN